jgi:dTDP-4-amino-4,6-dideoxygalactose transaminase
MKKAVFISAAPNIEKDDFWLAVKILFSPWRWRDKHLIVKFEKCIKETLGIKYTKTFDSGRSSIYVALKSLGIKKGDEVLIPSFTCLVVANAVSWTGAIPIYLDISNDDFNIALDDIEEKITKNTKALLVQHTFGKIIDVKSLRKRLPKNILVIEDWAHTIHTKNILYGDIGILTFGSEKVISSVKGGAIITNNEVLYRKIEKISQNLPEYPILNTILNIFNPIFWRVITPLYSIGFNCVNLGGIIRLFAFKLGLLGGVITKKELKGEKPSNLPSNISPALCILGLNQLQKLEKLNTHRAEIAKIYDKYLRKYSDYKEFSTDRVWLRYPILVMSEGKKKKIISLSKKEKIFIGDWYKYPLFASRVKSQAYKRNYFNRTMVPITISKCGKVLNLPTSINISKTRANKLAKLIKSVLESN